MSTQAVRQLSPQFLMTTIIGYESTELDQVISGLPWGDAFTYGAGVDALTGGIFGSALKPFTPQQRNRKSSPERYTFIQNKSEFNIEVEASASGKYNIEGGATVNAPASYLNEIKFSELCITLVAHYESRYDGYDEAPSYELTDTAKSMIGNPAAFRKSYGDYFISGGRRSSLFTAVYTCQTSSVENMSEFKANFAGEAPEVFSAEGSARFMQAVKNHNVKLSTYLHMQGYSGTPPNGPWTPEKVVQALGWFKQHEQGIELAAKLRHYSTIEPTYPRTVAVAPEVFAELRQLYITVWDMQAGYHSLPTYYQDRYKNRFIELKSFIMANKQVLATDPDKRQQGRLRADTLLSKINDVFARMDFYFKVRSKVGTEPAKYHVIKEDTGQQRWLYGFNTYTKSNAVVINETEMRHEERWEPFVVHNHTFEFGPDNKNLIVGWEVMSNWGDGTNGEWRKAVDKVLLTDHGVVHVRSQPWRGFDWTVRFYFVEAKDYHFESIERQCPTDEDL